MDFSLQVHEAKYIFPIPDGLKELSSDIIREVLRHQPPNINGFIADYLEAMLIVREQAKESGIVICDAFRESALYSELFRLKNVTREGINRYATVIQAAWRGYVVRRKISEWLKKKKKFEEQKEIKKSLKIEELLAGLGITYDESRRAAGIIEAAYTQSKKGKWVSGEFGEFWVEKSVPFGQRLREADRVQGRYDRWEKEDFGEFFEMDESGAIKYVWPRVGQLRKVHRDEIPDDIPIVEFFAMRDMNGHEQYSYLIKSRPETDLRGIPIGFLAPLPKRCLSEEHKEVGFVNEDSAAKMGEYTYVFREDVDREELAKFDEVLKARENVEELEGELGEWDYDPQFVVPRVLVRIKVGLIRGTDEEVKFVSIPNSLVCEQGKYTFRAETPTQTRKIIRHILRNKCLTVEEGLMEAANMKPYKVEETGRIFPVDMFSRPSYIQKLIITPETKTLENEALDFINNCYVFVPLNYPGARSLPKGESIMKISALAFHGFRPDFSGSSNLGNKVFIMGPKVTTPNGKPFTYESFFWDEFGEEAWFQLQYNIDDFEVAGEAEEEHTEEVPEATVEEQTEEEETTRGYETQSFLSVQPEQMDVEEPKVDTKEGIYMPTASAPSLAPTEAGEGKMEGIPVKDEEPELEPEPEPEQEPEPEPELEPEPEPEPKPEPTLTPEPKEEIKQEEPKEQE